jgi:hypothetical protein
LRFTEIFESTILPIGTIEKAISGLKEIDYTFNKYIKPEYLRSIHMLKDLKNN